MKSKIFAAAFLSIVSTVSAFATKPKSVPVTREIAITSPFQKIVVGDYLNVILVQDNNISAISVSGDEKSVQYVEVNIINNQLNISSRKGLEGKKITVHIPVKNISAVELSKGSSLSGEKVLKFPDLTVTVQEDAHVALKVLGEITILPGDNSDLVYDRNETYKVFYGTL